MTTYYNSKENSFSIGKFIFRSIGIFSLLIILALSTVRVVNCVSFSLNCSQYLKRAADANTVGLAQKNLVDAIIYLEEKNLTNGVVSIFLHQPKNDIGYFYTNLKASLKELQEVTDKTTQLEKTNVLMKLRETLCDNSKEGTTITCPDGISIYPYNALCFWIFIVFSTFSLIFIIVIFNEFLE
jgi:hypothetical protein